MMLKKLFNCLKVLIKELEQGVLKKADELGDIFLLKNLCIFSMSKYEFCSLSSRYKIINPGVVPRMICI